ncbi:RelB/DinJ family addiction module antitoxin [Secundilactobacillus pentosiphilus]|uniref:RelB/DinJ family addiction module antitoxin n=1 Tax=Secundilactobacillus pentosiphilus TaxID=1714682 RepID=A0A1Z5IZW1_9LACO|nr:type II toxin-antitoxin system RelB/DinJ family antitoxin [Secundilactobacillus pentosiphilus]GAX07112.1 RelB/DinJ family addiction module antitoxin [Secundilactobacillus pentosiphilus]
MTKVESKNARLSIRVDKSTKEEAQKIYAELGLDLSTAINIFLTQTVRTKSLPLDRLSLIPDDVKQAREDALHNHNLTSFNSVKELEDYINED